jgi:hypothetical protein
MEYQGWGSWGSCTSASTAFDHARLYQGALAWKVHILAIKRIRYIHPHREVLPISDGFDHWPHRKMRALLDHRTVRCSDTCTQPPAPHRPWDYSTWPSFQWPSARADTVPCRRKKFGEDIEQTVEREDGLEVVLRDVVLWRVGRWDDNLFFFGGDYGKRARALRKKRN